MNRSHNKGFTLIEMLVVIAVISVLVSIIVPVVNNASDKSAAAAEAITEEMNLAMMKYMPLRGALSFGGGSITREQIENLLVQLNR